MDHIRQTREELNRLLDEVHWNRKQVWMINWHTHTCVILFLDFWCQWPFLSFGAPIEKWAWQLSSAIYYCEYLLLSFSYGIFTCVYHRLHEMLVDSKMPNTIWIRQSVRWTRLFVPWIMQSTTSPLTYLVWAWWMSIKQHVWNVSWDIAYGVKR